MEIGRKSREGQFMLISAIVVGLMLMSLSATISEVNDREVRNSEVPYIMENIREEAEKIDATEKSERESFSKFVDGIEGYEAKIDYWSSHSPECLNVTLRGYRERYELHCLS